MDNEMRINKVKALVEELGGKFTIDDVDSYQKGIQHWTVFIELPTEYEHEFGSSWS